MFVRRESLVKRLETLAQRLVTPQLMGRAVRQRPRFSKKNPRPVRDEGMKHGSGIRTREAANRLPNYQFGALNHSAKAPNAVARRSGLFVLYACQQPKRSLWKQYFLYLSTSGECVPNLTSFGPCCTQGHPQDIALDPVVGCVLRSIRYGVRI